jgi:hypothetical protein
MTATFLLMLSMAPGCRDRDVWVDSGADSPVITDDTAERDSDPSDSVSGDSGTETGETGGVQETGDTAIEPVASLSLAPREFVVDPGAQWSLRATLLIEGEYSDVDPAYSVSDESILAVSADGLVTAVAPGSATIYADWDGLQAASAVTVQSSAKLKISVVRSEDGAAITTGKVRYSGTTIEVDELTGTAELDVPPGEAVWVTCWSTDDDRIPATVMHIIGRELVVPLRAQGDASRADAEIGGAYDFGGVPPLSDDEKAAGYIVLGLAGSSMRWGPLYWRPEELLSPNRDAEILGYPVRMPANITIMGEIETWSTPAWSGDAGVWSLAGPVPLVEALAGLVDLTAALDFLLSNVDGFVYGWDGGLLASADLALEIDVKPATSLSETVQVELPDWPAGIDIAQTAMLLALDGDGSEGAGVVGFGQGFPGTAHTSRAPGSFFGWDGSAAQVLAYLEIGGPGSGNARVLSTAAVVDGVATIRGFHEPPSLDSFDGATHDLVLTTDAGAHLVHLYVVSRDGAERDYYLPATSGMVNIPGEGPAFGWGVTEWEMTVVETRTGTFESWSTEGAVLRENLAEHALMTSFVNQKFSGS